MADQEVVASYSVTKLPGPIEILKQAWGIYVNRFWVLLGISLVPFVLAGIFIAVIGGGTAVGTVLFLKLAALATVAIVIAVIVLFVLVYIAIIYVSIWAQAALLCAVKGAEQKIGIRDSFRQASHKIGSLFGSAVLSFVIVACAVLVPFIGFGIIYLIVHVFVPSISTYVDVILGVLLFICTVVVATVFAVRYSLAGYVVIGDDTTALSGIKRSRDYVKGYWWPVFWRTVFFVVILFVGTFAVFFVVLLLGLVLKSAGTAGSILVVVVNVLLSAVLPPLYATYAYQIYANLRAVKGESQVPPDKKVGAWVVVGIALAIVVIFSAPVGLLALNSARADARDQKRAADAQVIFSGLALYFNAEGSYPTDLSQLVPKYLDSVPTAPPPADGSCTAAENQYQYELVSPTDYSFTFCTGNALGSYVAGMHVMTAQGIGSGSAPGSAQLGDTTTVQMNTYHDPNFNFQYPVSWLVTSTGNPPVDPTSCGDAWGDAAGCVTLNPSAFGKNPATSAVEVLAFSTTVSPLAWCQARTGVMGSCTSLDGAENSIVGAESNPGDFPQVQYEIVGGSTTLAVFELTSSTYQSDFNSIVNSAQVQ